MDFKKIFVQALLLTATSLALYLIANIGLNYRSQSSLQLEQTWRDDISTLKSKNKLPISWNEVKVVAKIFAPEDKRAESWSKSASTPIDINPNGEYKLEILFVSDNEDGALRAIIRHHLIHMPSGNSTWELSRTYILD